MNIKNFGVVSAILLEALFAGACLAQSAAPTVYKEDFTGTATTNNWYFFNGACLTAGTNATSTNPGNGPACTSMLSSYYGVQSDKDPSLVGGSLGYLGSATAPANRTKQVADPAGSGALRFTNGFPYGHAENGAIVSADTFDTTQGLQVTFSTVTYRGDSQGSANDGADGISFYLMDGSQPPGIGAWGGSLAYTCSNANPPYNGLVGGYIGLGIDEWGNFLNGNTLMPGYTGSNSATSDNTAQGYGFKPGRIGIRGGGSVAWTWLHSTNPTLYPSTLNSAQQQNITKLTCRDGVLYDGSKNPNSPTKTTTPVADYAPIVNAYKELTGIQIANEAAQTRAAANVIDYNLTISPDGLLSLSYRFNRGASQPVITKQSIAAANGLLPASLRFGFAGSTGGSTNIHEIMCFKAAAADQSGSSATVNEKQAAKVESGTQAYFAYYNSTNWTGNVTANHLTDIGGVVTVDTPAKWDASCVLDGVGAALKCGKTLASGPILAQDPSTRVMITWNGTAGAPFTAAGLTSGQLNMLDALDSTLTPAPGSTDRLDYMRGARGKEVNSAGVGLFRKRDSVLGDIVDSSPAWVGPPSSPYATTWTDLLSPLTSMPENAGSVSYASFASTKQSRLNVVYVGANDGFVHGFRTGSVDSAGNLPAANNDGQEVLAYMPGAILQSAATASATGGCANLVTTSTVVQNIHGATPAIGKNSLCVQTELDYSSPQYGHNFFVDASPGTGDLFYGGTWHTWLVGGLGAGGQAIYALDITDPSVNFPNATAAASSVIGEWTSATISCVGDSTTTKCGANMGNTYGTPQIRRLHNGTWGVIFGNGIGSANGDAGIYVMTIDPTSGKAGPIYYISTGQAGGNGIAYATTADLDGDHITDYVYAGDLHGNVWRFDLTNSLASNWTASAFPLFATNAGQPITSQLLAVSVIATGNLPQVMIEFGTGQRTQLTNTSAESFVGGTQDMYGVWDWNMLSWNSKSTVKYRNLADNSTTTATATATGLASPYTLGYTNLQTQTFTAGASAGVIDGTNTPVCWRGTGSCSAAGGFGWVADLIGASEQIIFNPVFFQGAFIVDSAIPAGAVVTSCSIPSDTGYTYAISVANGGVFNSVFPNYKDKNGNTVVDPNEAGVQTNATGSPFVVTTTQGTTNFVYQTVSGTPGAQQANIPANTSAKRLTWIERR